MLAQVIADILEAIYLQHHIPDGDNLQMKNAGGLDNELRAQGGKHEM